MDLPALLLPSSGRLSSRPFVLGAVLVYAASLCSQALIAAPVLGHTGLWPFGLIQALLVWGWYTLHAKRLRDADIGDGGAAGIAVIYILAIVLLLIAMTFFLGGQSIGAGPGETGSFGFLPLLGAAARTAERGGLDLLLSGFVAVACLPVVLGLGFSIWTATRPSLAAAPPASGSPAAA